MRDARGESARRGKWHGLVSLPVARSRRLRAFAEAACLESKRSGLQPLADLHVSASKPFALWAHQVEPFLAKLRLELAPVAPFSLQISSDGVDLSSGDGAQAFAALAVLSGAALRLVVAAADNALAAFGEEVYFDPAIFHVSVAATEVVAEVDAGAEQPAKRTKVAEPDADAGGSDGSDDGGSDSDNSAARGAVVVCVSEVVVRIGHKSIAIALRAPQ
ncbi:hypothetical protein M885DRAFT_504265 [Pelagophyceae sp. CCMP2097]|nr:hypothetical protein M885DRAFT_504265 [Pelagophyceae sp. CCMP2097]